MQEKSTISRRYLDYSATKMKIMQEELHGQNNHATVTAFEGKLNKIYFTKALKILFQAHPNLRVKKIKYDTEKNLFYVDEELSFSDIPYRFIEIDQESDWKMILDKELSTPFPSNGPYWKAYCLTVKNSSPFRHYFIQFFDHALSDGTSTAKLNDTFFTYYQLLLEQKTIDTPKKYLPPPITALCPQEEKCNWLNYKNKQEQLTKLYPMSQGEIYERQAPLNQRSTHSVLFSLKQAPLYKLSKAHNITVNELLVATSLLALRNTQSEKKPSFDTSILTCINLRNPKVGHVNAVNANYLACLFNAVVFPQKIQATSTIWSIAKNYRALLKIFIQQIAHPPEQFSIKETRDQIGIDSVYKRSHFTGGVSTSNLGRIDLKKKYGEIDIIFYHFFSNQRASFFETLLNFSCIDDTIYCNAVYIEPLHSRKWAVQFVSNFIQELQAILSQPLIIKSTTDNDVLKATYAN